MPRIKGTDVASLRTLLHEKGAQAEEALLARLPPGLRKVFLETSPLTWNPVELQAQLYEVAGPFLFPDHREPIVEMHKVLARASYSSIYRAFVRLPTVEFIARRAAGVWRSYYDSGDATIENATQNGLDFVVRQFAELPRAMRDATTGHLAVFLEVIRAKDGAVVPPADGSDPWVWHVSWS